MNNKEIYKENFKLAIPIFGELRKYYKKLKKKYPVKKIK
jgi:hypothetical protein